jgi:DNA-binding NarL/FixJ family response regulator
MTKSRYSPIRVIVADDHEIFRDGFRSLLKKQQDIELVAEAENGKELVDLTIKHKPDVIITDVKMPKSDGIEATKEIEEKYPHIGVIALSMFDEESLIVDMLEAGAKGYLLKNAGKEEIIEAIKTVYNNGTYYCHHTSNRLAQMIASSKFNPYRKTRTPNFNEKEVEVIQKICEGFSSKEIGEQLHLSIRTIEGYREKIQEKMKVHNTAGIVVYAIKKGIYKI